MKQCSFCGNSRVEERTTDYIYRHEGRYLIVTGVPCEECTYCGERYYAANDLRKIEAEFGRLQHGGKRPELAITVPVESFAHI